MPNLITLVSPPPGSGKLLNQHPCALVRRASLHRRKRASQGVGVSPAPAKFASAVALLRFHSAARVPNDAGAVRKKLSRRSQGCKSFGRFPQGCCKGRSRSRFLNDRNWHICDMARWLIQARNPPQCGNLQKRQAAFLEPTTFAPPATVLPTWPKSR